MKIPFFGKDSENEKSQKDQNQDTVIDHISVKKAKELTTSLRTKWGEAQGGGDKFGTLLLSSLDKAVAIQSGTIVSYVEGVKKRNPDASQAKRQEEIDKHFLAVATGTGATAGGAAAIPGVGFVTGTAAVAGESLLFLEAAAWYILASANLRGIDITSKDLRRALVMLILSGSRGVSVVDTFAADSGEGGKPNSLSSITNLSRFSAPSLSGLNKRLAKTFTKQVAKRFKWAWVGKLMPLGIGAVLGGIANRKLARMVMDNAHAQLDSLQGA